MSACWSCGVVRALSASDATLPVRSVEGFTCIGCGAIQPPERDRTHFARLLLEPCVWLDEEELSRRFRELSRRLHPDRYAGRSARERRLALEHMTAVNDAYRCLRDPVRRAEYLLSLHGVCVGEGGESEGPRPDPALLSEVMELRESVDEARRDPEKARQMADQLTADVRRCLDAIDRITREHATQAMDARSRAQAHASLTRLKYMQSALSDLRREEQGRAEASSPASMT